MPLVLHCLQKLNYMILFLNCFFVSFNSYLLVFTGFPSVIHTHTHPSPVFVLLFEVDSEAEAKNSVSVLPVHKGHSLHGALPVHTGRFLHEVLPFFLLQR